MAFSADPAAAPPRLGAIFRLLMQLRLLLVAVTIVPLVGSPVGPSPIIALTAAAFCSWLAVWHWERIMRVVSRHPILLGLDVVVAFAVLELGGPLGPFFLFTVVTAAVAGLLFRWRGVVYFGTLQVLCYYGALGVATEPATWSFQALLGQPAYYPLVGFVGVRVRRLLDEQVQAAEAQRRAEVTAAAAEERARLARELHDSLAKTLRGLAMSARALPMWVSRSPQRAAEEAERMALAAETASREARGLVSDLRSDDLGESLASSVRDVATGWARDAGIALDVDATTEVTTSLLVRYEAVAVLREATTNIERHAGASHVCVSLTDHGDGQATLTVTDDGRGFAVTAGPQRAQREGHYGLVGMHERMARAGGTLTVGSVPGQGTAVRATFPVIAVPGSEIQQGKQDRRDVAATGGERDAPTRRRPSSKPVETP